MPTKTKEATTNTKQQRCQSFVRVPNDWFNLNGQEQTFASKLNPKRFTLWFYLQKLSVEMNMSNVVQIQIKKTCDDMSKLTGFSKPENIRKLLLELKSCNLIECKELSSKSKPSDLLSIKLIEQDYSKGFSAISTQLYDDKINKIGCNGLLLFCLLFKNHNNNIVKTDTNAYNQGFAKINREAIARFIGIKNYQTISDTIQLLKKARQLIKITPSEKYLQKDEFGHMQTVWSGHKYTILPKCEPSNKYHSNNFDG